ncbi:hypothetical protein CEXT_201361 [Caerostris extrusa]|uniref:Secreted protein n=1 Tax=Caerostris extrusa TaxID=172846 RepID=A0AAV4P0Q5_CAEEX|nr:hypothetical protein CEXT_201361 [Caerostris extrusa]
MIVHHQKVNLGVLTLTIRILTCRANRTLAVAKATMTQTELIQHASAFVGKQHIKKRPGQCELYAGKIMQRCQWKLGAIISIRCYKKRFENN